MGGGDKNGIRWDIDAVCPFYRRVRHQAREIVCESGVPEAAVAAVRFSSDDAMRVHLRTVCCDLDACVNCPGFQAAARKYEEQK